MKMALRLARRGLGQVFPNPAVGCVLVKNESTCHVVGRGWTQPGGRPHAEVEAIRRAGKLAHGSTAYITLEPCNHFGKTSPCTTALIKAGIKKVYIATKDPDKRVSGRGIKALQEAGVTVMLGLLKSEAKILNAGFFSRIKHNRPLISWKVASSIDGKIATNSGESKWITNNLSRTHGHLLRAENDAILTSARTIKIDNPQLTCRLPGMEKRSPQPVVIDQNLKIPTVSNLFKQNQKPWIYAATDACCQKKDRLEQLGAQIFLIPKDSNKKLNLTEVASHLAQKGITRVLIECGGVLASSFLNENLIDKIFWFRSSKLIGNKGLSAVGELNVTRIEDAMQFSPEETTSLDNDCLSVFQRII